MNEIIAEIAFKNHQDIISVKNRIGKDLLGLASLLTVNHDNRYYKTLGYSTWEEFLATPEISMSRFFAYKLMQIDRVWVQEYSVSPAKLQGIDSEKLYLMGTMINKNLTNEEIEERLEQARTLSRSDVKQLKSGKEYEYERYKIVTCPHCGGEVKVVL